MTRPLLSLAVLAALPALVAACSFSGPSAPEEKEDLHYQLVTFHGQSVPGVIQESGDARVEILSGSFVLAPLGECTSRTDWQRTEGGETTSGTSELTCTWSGSGADMAFMWDGGEESAGSSDGTALTVTVPTGIQCVTEPCPAEWTATYQFAPM